VTETLRPVLGPDGKLHRKQELDEPAPPAPPEPIFAPRSADAWAAASTTPSGG
jgi:hypothetical protein